MIHARSESLQSDQFRHSMDNRCTFMDTYIPKLCRIMACRTVFRKPAPPNIGLFFRGLGRLSYLVLESADLGGRVGWLPKAEGGGGVSRLRFPPGPHLRSSRFSRHPRLRQAPARRFAEKS